MASGGAVTASPDVDASVAPAGTGTTDFRPLPVGVGWTGIFENSGIQPTVGRGSGGAEFCTVGAEGLSEDMGEKILAGNTKFENLFKSAGKHKFKFARSLNRMFQP